MLCKAFTGQLVYREYDAALWPNVQTLAVVDPCISVASLARVSDWLSRLKGAGCPLSKKNDIR